MIAGQPDLVCMCRLSRGLVGATTERQRKASTEEERLRKTAAHKPRYLNVALGTTLYEFPLSSSSDSSRHAVVS
jgi:hypothetical protein